jgi:general secretion pathway protein F
MATCLDSGLPLQKCLELSGAGTESQKLQAAVRTAVVRCDEGLTLSEALAPEAGIFPRYFLPVLRAGEAGGRLVEAFQLVHQHCRRIGPTLRVVRNTWLYPLVCILFGWVLRAGIFVYFGKYQMAWRFVEAQFGTVLLFALAGWLLFKLAPVKRVVDFVRLEIPFLREIELRLALVWFLATFRLTYEAGGLEVVRMFDLALATVDHDAIRRDLLKVRPVLEQHGTFGDAFEESDLLTDDLKGLIRTGSLSGQLDQSLAQIVARAAWQLELSLQTFNQLFQRVVVFCVAMAIVETVLMCVL